MKRHFVHIYHTMRSKFAVDAESHKDAIDKAQEIFLLSSPVRSGMMGLVTPSMELDVHAQVGLGYLLSEDADEVTGFLVDEVGDEGHENSLFYDERGDVILLGHGPMSVSLDSRERDTILAALRLWQRIGGEGTDELDIATCGGEHDGLDNAGIDALCERLNK